MAEKRIRRPDVRAIGWFIGRAIALYAAFLFCWAPLLPKYVAAVTPVSNLELRALGVANTTRLGPSRDPRYEVAVYHREAAGMSDSLFDFKIEAFRSHVPMLLALIFATPIRLWRRIKAAAVSLGCMYLIDSLVCVLIMIWSYTFLPDQHEWTPFAASPVRDAIVGTLYSMYNSVGVVFVPLILWIATSIRKEDLRGI